MSKSNLIPLVMDTPSDRKARGAFFTPDALTSYMADWAIRTPSDRVLEPSCGDANFLVAAAANLREQGQLFPRVTGVDIHGPSLEDAAERLRAIGAQPDLRHADFFDLTAKAEFDAVIGNPPYIRYQCFTGDAREKGLDVAASHGVKLSQLANVWAAFTVHATRFLKNDGRLALVLPAVLLTANYAEPVRKYLLSRFSKVTVVTFLERVFPDVQEDVLLLLAEGKGKTNKIEVATLRNADDLNDTALESTRGVAIAEGSSERWSPGLLAKGPVDLHKTLTEQFETLDDWGAVELGIVSGNNKFFTLSAARVAELGLTASDVRRVSPPGSKHLRGLTFGSQYLDVLTEEGRPTYLFYPRGEPSPAALKYIAEGERLGVHKGYKCRNRKVWWKVPLTAVPDLVLTYMSGDAPRIVSNGAGVHVLNSVHGVRVEAKRRQVAMDLLPAAMLNSVTLLGAELVGRSYGGGILKVEPREARRLPLPAFSDLEDAGDLLAFRSQLGGPLRKGDLLEAVKRVDDVLLVRHLGMSRGDVSEIRAAWGDMRSRREARGKKSR